MIAITPELRLILACAETIEIEVDESSEPAEAKARIAELEAQAAIGLRAVAVLKGLEWPVSRLTGERYCPSCWQYASHNSACEMAAILRDADKQNRGE